MAPKTPCSTSLRIRRSSRSKRPDTSVAVRASISVPHTGNTIGPQLGPCKAHMRLCLSVLRGATPGDGFPAARERLQRPRWQTRYREPIVGICPRRPCPPVCLPMHPRSPSRSRDHKPSCVQSRRVRRRCEGARRRGTSWSLASCSRLGAACLVVTTHPPWPAGGLRLRWPWFVATRSVPNPSCRGRGELASASIDVPGMILRCPPTGGVRGGVRHPATACPSRRVTG